MAIGVATQGAAGEADRIAQAHARLLTDHSLQFTFKAVIPPKTPEWLEAIAKAIAYVAPVLKWVFWAGLAIAVVAILYFIGRELIRLRWPEQKAKAAAPVGADWRPDAGKARALLEDADRLAAEGRYDEAAHLLLHRSIDDLEGRRPRAVRPALTARDIADLESLPAAARPAFQTIAEAVERSFFGGRTLDADAFAHCRRAYEAFAFPEAWA